MSKTKLPDLIIGNTVINPPIIQGGMGVRVSRSSLASAVSNAGGLGVIASVGLSREDISEEEYEKSSSEALKAEIKKTRELTLEPFGVNIMCALTNYDALVRTTSEENVSVIISGAGLPLHLPGLVENSFTQLIPIVSSLRASSIILRTWIKRYQKLPDAFIVEGPLAGGHLGFSYTEVIDTKEFFLEDILKEVIGLVKEYEISYHKKIPVIAAGGIYTGADIAHMLKLGASGVQIATRFVCTEECDVSDRYKEAYLICKKEDIAIILSPVGLPARIIKNKFVERIQAGEKIKFKCPYKCLKTCDPYSANYCIAHALVQSSMGNLEDGFVMCGANAWRLNRIIKVQELMNELIEEAEVDFYRDNF